MARSSQPLVLEYKKRRYDGGNEREMIEHIEMQQQLLEQQRVQQNVQVAGQSMASHSVATMAHRHHPTLQPIVAPTPVARHVPEAQAETASTGKEKGSFLGKIALAFFTPVVELIWGLSGLFVAGIITLTVSKKSAVNRQFIDHDRKLLLSQSWKVIRNSVLGIFSAPWLAYRLCLQ